MHAGHERHDGGGPDGDVLAAPEHAVHEAAHEGGVEAVLGRQPGHDGIGDTLGQSEVSIRAANDLSVPSSYWPAHLGDDCEADCEAGDEVGDGEVEVVVGEPVRDGQLAT